MIFFHIWDSRDWLYKKVSKTGFNLIYEKGGISVWQGKKFKRIKIKKRYNLYFYLPLYKMMNELYQDFEYRGYFWGRHIKVFFISLWFGCDGWTGRKEWKNESGFINVLDIEHRRLQITEKELCNRGIRREIYAASTREK